MTSKSEKPNGRPTLFTAEVLEEILEWVSHGGTERAYFRQEGKPSWRAWTNFKRNSPSFLPQLMIAKEDYCEVKEDEIYNIAMDRSSDYHAWEETTVGPKGTTVKTGVTSDNTFVQRHRLQIDTIWKIMRSTMPRKYGDKVQQEISGPGGGPIPVVNIGAKTSTE